MVIGLGGGGHRRDGGLREGTTHTRGDGSPLRLGGATVGTATVARLRSDLISHLAIGQSFSNCVTHCFYPLLLMLFRIR